MHRIGGDVIIAVLLFLLLVLYSLPSLALQPVQAFVEGARLRNPDALEAQANLSQQRAQADAALGRVLPGVSARGAYTRNQFSSQIDLAAPGQPSQVVTIVPRDQWDGSATLNVPLIDLANFRRVGAQKTSAEGAARQLDSTRLQVEAQVVQDYYQV
ncbi:MAG TPA: TolC family protein, partial [Myxococcales bacterium]|nr:TolC family protein [Myxococcales bacterium]